ncbi:hypothetical protein EMIHUDRAFT_211722 [Emiliania huxleyi CCMP1516]|uniref:Uroporphyrinogen-III synthase n=2 Tax=Emiliania huxleyi TaxID=2903 RepID=A0A0D3ISU2_EMIH1|nr:hypothetical protein EMIHUDRAFT_211722 [Emiliania huxleyi CCMP1516]EOD14327.1 hypothetical protein EMIHUDRAFT_211722 [Emiliania huxleyi CCMP1516]|eukprot:XP_005766756.1 hypothetical protein EMIHUDRAFT_211722 [Emiliania huxleyi CCMP1516]
MSFAWTLVVALSVPQQPDAALPLAGKRIAFTSPRAVAAPFSAELISAGARPVWWPLVEAVPLPESELGPLDDLIMRMPESCAVALLSRHAADAFVERGKEAEEEALVAALLAAGADADAVEACAIRPLLASGHELSLLREGGLDAVCVGSAEEANALAAALEAAEGASDE